MQTNMALGVLGLAIGLAGLLIVLLVLYFLFFCIRNFNIWLEAKAAGLDVGFLDLLLMKFRKIQSRQIVDALKMLHKAGVSVTCAELEDHVLSGGHLERTALAVVAAHKAGLPLGFQKIAAIDLAGRDVVDAIESHVNPKVLVCPQDAQGRPLPQGLTGVAKDGIRLAVKARVTVRTRLEKMVGGAGEATIIARVGEGIVATIGRADKHTDILAEPERISNAILEKGLDKGSCFEILSMDIADIDVVDNVAARLQSDKAQADKEIAHARASQRRANAIASQQEMAAENLNSEAKVILAKSNVPESLACALRKNHLGTPRPLAPVMENSLKWKVL